MKFGCNSIAPVQWLSAPELCATSEDILSSIEQGQSVLALVDQQYWQTYPLVKSEIKAIKIPYSPE